MVVTVTNNGDVYGDRTFTLTVGNAGFNKQDYLTAGWGTIAAGGTHNSTVSVPGSAGLDGAEVAERVSGTYTGGTFWRLHHARSSPKHSE